MLSPPLTYAAPPHRAPQLTSSRPSLLSGGVTPTEALMATARASGEELHQRPYPAQAPPLPETAA